MTEIQELISYLNDTGGIPLVVKTVTETNWSQFTINIMIALLSSFMIIMFLWDAHIKPPLLNLIVKIRLRKIKKITGKDILILKHTKSGLFDMSMINQSTLTKVTTALNNFKGNDFDLVLYTPGGEIFSSMYISRLLKNYPGKKIAYIPIYSMSGGTLLALSCDKIFMGSNACLGAVDPQLGNLFKYGSAKSWKKIAKYKGKKAEDSTLSFSFTGEQYTKSISNHISSLLDSKISDKQNKELTRLLTSGDIEHGYQFTANDLRKFGLKIEDSVMNTYPKFIQKILTKNVYEGVYST